MAEARPAASSNLKRTIPLILLAAIIGALWYAGRVRRAPAGTAASRDEIREGPSESGADLAARVETKDADSREAQNEMPVSASPVAANSIGIRSSAGLKLAFVEIQENDVPWQRRELVAGRCELESAALPCRLRAPGHTPTAVERLGGDLVLEPDALLVLKTPGLRACVESIEPLRPWLNPKNPKAVENADRLAHFASFGFLDDDRWAIAVTSKLLAAFTADRRLHITLERHDRRHVDILFDSVPGARASWSPPCSDVLDVAPLDVTLAWPEGERHGEVQLRLWIMRQRVIGVDTTTEFPWGVVGIGPLSSAYLQTWLKAGSDSAPLGPYPKGVSYGLTAVDRDSGAYGGMTFEHDGTPRTLSMHPGFAILGVVSVPPGVALPTRAKMFWEYVGSDQGRSSWLGDQSDVPMGTGGEFEAHGMATVPIERTSNLDPPPNLDLTVEAPGFELFHRTYATGGARRFDCGVVALSPKKPQLTLAPGFQVDERSLESKQLRISARPDFAWMIRNCRRQLDGSLALFLESEGGGVSGKERFHFWSDATGKDDDETFPESPGDFALIDPGDVGVALRLRADGLYEPVATRSCTLDIECSSMPTSGGPWILGWRWQGLSMAASQVTAEFEGERTRLELSIPEDGVTLWWSGSGIPPDVGAGAKGEGGTIPATGSLLHLTLP